MKPTLSALLPLLVALWVAPAALHAQSPPTIDGWIDEPVWSTHGFTTDYQATEGSRATLYQIDDPSLDPSFIYLAWEITRDFVDNSYADGQNSPSLHSTWPSGHTFGDLCESDGQQLQILNVCGEDVVDIFMDYLDGGLTECGGSTYPSHSGFGVGTGATETNLIQINGGDWTKFTYSTSLVHNLNTYCDGQNDCDGDTLSGTTVDLLVESPPFADEANYVAASPYDDWRYTHVYEMKIDRSVFPTSQCSQGTPAIIRTDPVELHASPSKTGETPVTLFRSFSTIGDYVWFDVDRDGKQDAGEPGFGNVTLELRTDPNGDGDLSDGALVGRTVTDPDGFYSFTQLGSGTYGVTVTDELGVLAGFSPTVGTTDPHAPIDLPLQEEYLLADFGYAPTDTSGAVVGDFVWVDVDGDGIQDPGEPGIGGVELGIFDAATQAQVGASVTTGPDGLYLFTGLPKGDYYVDVLSGVPTGYTLTTGPQSETDPSTPFKVDPDGVTGPEIYLNADFGYQPAANTTGTIGNLLFFDVDEDAVHDAGEPGLGNVTLSLVQDVNGDGLWDLDGADDTAGTDDDELILAGTKTAADGTYQFTGLPLDDGGGDANYIVVVTDAFNVLGGFLKAIFLPQPASADGESKHVPAAAGWPVTLSSSTTSDQTADFGYLLDNPEALVGDRVWYDADSDGVQDFNEPGIEGVVMLLYQEQGGNKAPLLVGTRTTDINGNYYFPRLDFGGKGQTYIAHVAAENFAIFDGLVDLDADGDVDADDDGSLNGVTIIDGFLDIDGSGTITAADDGFWNGADVIDGVIDLDGDGTAGETNGDDGSQGVLGDYLQTGDPDEAGTCATCDGSSSTLLDSNNRIDLTLDFGYRWRGTGHIGDTVYEDANANYTQDAGEQGVEGVTVALYEDLDGDGLIGIDEPLLAVDTTDGNGNYLFDNLVARDYLVTVSDEAGILQGYRQTEGDEVEGVPFTALSTLDVDFGFVRSSAEGVVGDTVWLDADADALRGATETGISGVTLNLYADADGDFVCEPGGDDGAPIATTVTDGNGNYLFTGVTAGYYCVEVDDATLPAGVTLTPGMSEPTAVFALPEGGSHLTADFGYVPSGTTAVIGDFVWNDADDDGFQDPGEVGIPNVTITLFDSSQNVVATVDTDARGEWLITGLAPGDYVVTYDPADVPAGMDGTQPTNLAAGNDRYAFTLQAGNILLTLDFGFHGGTWGAIGDFVWLDSDGDGVQDAGEAGIEGVTLDLVADENQDGVLDAGDTRLATTTTDAAGAYTFTGLVLDDGGGDSDFDYLVEVTDAGNVLARLIATSGPQARTSAYATALSSGTTSDLTADFGYKPAAGSIGNLVWHDVDGDGVRDSGEAGIGGVTLSLWRDADADGVFEPGTDDYRVRTNTTSASGGYLWTGLTLDASYFVTVTDVNGVLAGFTKTSGTAGADGNSQADPYLVTLTSGSAEQNLTADFGYEATMPYNLSGTVFEDVAEDQTFDGNEDVFSGIPVVLHRIVGGERYDLGTTTTDANGFYQFTGLPNGDYELEVIDTETVLENYFQTTQTGTGGVEPATISNADSPDHDFGFTQGATTTPVTLAWFRSVERGNGTVLFHWQTATEVGNVGFDLWVEEEGGWRRLNAEPIPSKVIDSTTPQTYRFEAEGVEGDRFLLEDLDIVGGSQIHGPFTRGTAAGHPVEEAERIDWQAVATEHDQGRAGRGDRGRSPKGVDAAAYLEVTGDGVHRVSYEDLVAAGVDLGGVPPRLLSLTLAGEPVPMRVLARGTFGPGDAVEFVGRAADTLYTRTNVYTLRVGDSAAPRMAEDRRSAGPGDEVADFYLESRRLEDDRMYSPLSPNGDPWIDRFVFTFGSPGRASFPLELDAWVPGAAPVEAAVELWGGTGSDGVDPDHHVALEANGIPVADLRFDGRVPATVGGEIPDHVLAGSGDRLELVLPGDVDVPIEMVMLDAYRVSYPRAFEARDDFLRFTAAAEAFEVRGFSGPAVEAYREAAGSVERLAGGSVTMEADGTYTAAFPGDPVEATYWVAGPDAVRRPAVRPRTEPDDLLEGEAELLVISHPHFIDGLQPLVEHRRSQGWSVRVVDVEDVYTRYAHGMFGPEAIERFVDEAAAALGTTHLLLVGGDSYDYHDNLGVGSMSFLPSPYTRTGRFVHFAPADNLYADVDEDGAPDLAVGRFPVRTADELTALVEKTLAYEDRPAPGSALMAADAWDPNTTVPFASSSEHLIGFVPPDWSVERIYIDRLGKAAARDRLLQAMDLGPSVVSYMGHSGLREWSFQGLFRARDARNLGNAGAPSVVTQWGCWTTYHVDPAYNTLGHELLLNGDRGAVAVLGAATLTQSRSERILAAEIFERLFAPGATLGEAIRDSKRELVSEGEPAVADVVLGWTLLGDPTLRVEP